MVKGSKVLLIIVILYMGLRPVSGRYFGDMRAYFNYFEYYAKGGIIESSKDILWHLFMRFCSGIMTSKLFFLICAFLYITPLYKASKNWFKDNNYILFLMFISSFSFWGYGVNGIRNGIATSFFILAFSIKDKFVIKYFILIISLLTHFSIIIPISALASTYFVKNTKYYIFLWLVCIPLSLFIGDIFQPLFASFFSDDRISYLTEGNINNDRFSKIGFRFDFILYSSLAIFAGYYFIIKKGFKDKVYIQLFNVYVLSNCIWILIIKANFSNRFAYLSWFLMAAVIFYPFFKERFFKNQRKILAYTMLGYFVVSYLLWLIM